MRKRKHRTFHYPDPDDEGRVLVACECGWRDRIDVRGLSWVEGMEAIFAARDTHEENPATHSEGE